MKLNIQSIYPFLELSMFSWIIVFVSIFHGLLYSKDAVQSSGKEKVTNVLKNLILKEKAPGLQYSFASYESVLYSYQVGVSDVSANSMITSESTFMGFSVTKTITGLAISELVNQKKLSLDDPISKYLDYFPYKENPTIRETLNHTAGFPNPIPISWSHLEEEHSSFNRKEFLYNVLNENNELKNPPGKKYAYSNIGYLLLGEVIEKISGVSYEEFVVKNILSKLNLKEGEILTFQIPDRKQMATGYIERFSFLNFMLGWLLDRDKFLLDSQEKWTPFRRFYVNGTPYGGLFGNAAGFTRFLQEILKPKGAFASHLSYIFSSKDSREDRPVSMGWFRGKVNGNLYFGHAGAGGGYYCEIRFYPEINRSSVIMINRSGMSDEKILDQLDIHLLSDEIKSKE